MNKNEIEQILKKERSAFAKKGVEARKAKLSPERRSEIAKKAAMARWAKYSKTKEVK